MRHVMLAVLLTIVPLGAGAQTLYVEENDAGFLNLREGPGTRYDVVSKLAPGDRVDVQESVGRWYRVRLPSGEEGWVAGDFLGRAAPSPGAPIFVAQTGEGYLNLRAGPGTDHEILRRMYPGDRLQPLERQGDWLRVRHVSGAIGWAHGGYVTAP